MFDQATADTICQQLAEGKSLRSICRGVGLPESTVRGWETDNDEFAAQSARARVIGCHSLADETLEIADEKGEDVQRARLRIDTRFRLLGKWLPKVYGDKLDLDVKGTMAVKLDGTDGGVL